MSYNIGSDWKGELGEISVKREFSDFQLLGNSKYDVEVPDRDSKEGKKLTYFYYLNGVYYKNGVLYKNEKWDAHRGRKIRERFGSLITPDFLVEGTKIFIEVKTGKSAKLEKNQMEGFPKILQKGYRIFIVRPKLLIEKRKFEVIDFYCSEFLGKNKRTRITLAELKELIKKQLIPKADISVDT